MVGHHSGLKKGGGRKNEKNKVYASPLPLLFSVPETFLSHKLCAFLGINNVKVLNPLCTGVLDIATRSVWVVDPRDAGILWTRGFFGKGDLSRSEPSWHARQVNAKKAAGICTYFSRCGHIGFVNSEIFRSHLRRDP